MSGPQQLFWQYESIGSISQQQIPRKLGMTTLNAGFRVTPSLRGVCCGHLFPVTLDYRIHRYSPSGTAPVSFVLPAPH